MVKLFKGNVINPKSPSELEVRENCIIAVKNGIIDAMFDDLSSLPEEYHGIKIEDFKDGIIIPSFTDLHIHVSQYVQRGVGMDVLLFDWLNNYTFPQEANFRNIDYARTIYSQVIRDMLRNGTTQVAPFTTIHYDACDLFFRMLEESGMYSYMNKINMDMNSPEYYVEGTEESIAETERFICEHSGSKWSGRNRLIMVPRFAPTCSDALLRGLGKLADKYDLGLHTHLVESKAEAAWSAELFPQYGSDGAIYEQCGLMAGGGPKIFAHVIFPSEVEYELLKNYTTYSVHCPISTNNITAGIMPVSDLMKRGLRVALGTDVGGGHDMALYKVIGSAIQSSKLKAFYEENYSRIDLAKAFYLATAGGGSAFGWFGKLEPGYHFNALVLDGLQDDGFELPLLECLERFCYAGDDRNITHRFIDGDLIDPDEVFSRISQL
ncbi:MAG: amidohydrolase family protein [Oscillospiraceae bacterium]|nr:amidohydrolase family protein [Oscillospiraceae bacterium]